MKRLPTLSDYETSNLDDYEHMQSGTWDKGRGAVRPARAPAPTPISAGAVPGLPSWCWCGDLTGHDWPGRADGAPHPSNRRTA